MRRSFEAGVGDFHATMYHEDLRVDNKDGQVLRTCGNIHLSSVSLDILYGILGEFNMGKILLSGMNSYGSIPRTDPTHPTQLMTARDLDTQTPMIAIANVLFSDQLLYNVNPSFRDASVVLLSELLLRSSFQIPKILFNDLLFNIRSRLESRLPGFDDRKQPGSEAILGCLDTEGWGTLETSLKTLRLILRSDGLPPDSDLVTVLSVVINSIRHKNRYAREQGLLCLSEVLRLFPDPVSSHDIDILLVCGLQDNWSQVRYAALIALRAFLRDSLRKDFDSVYSKPLIAHLLINRHFPAEGVRRLAQEVWRLFTGPAGGSRILGDVLPDILGVLSNLIDSDNHSVREAIMSLCLELSKKVFGSSVNSRVCSFGSLLKICVHGLEDDAWFISRVAVDIVQYVYGDYLMEGRDDVQGVAELLVNRILECLIPLASSPIKTLREDSIQAFIMVLRWSRKSPGRHGVLSNVLSRMSSTFTVRALRRLSNESGYNLKCSASTENQTMYSCGSFMSNEALRQHASHSTSDECCSSVGPSHNFTELDALQGLLRILVAILRDAGLGSLNDLPCLLSKSTEFFDSLLSVDYRPLVPEEIIAVLDTRHKFI